MSGHDPLCPWRPDPHWRDLRVPPADCQCDLIAAVRADQRERGCR